MNFPQLKRAFKKKQKKKNLSSVAFLRSFQVKMCSLYSSRCQPVKFSITKRWTNVRKLSAIFSILSCVRFHPLYLCRTWFRSLMCTSKNTLYSEILITVIPNSSSEGRLRADDVFCLQRGKIMNHIWHRRILRWVTNLSWFTSLQTVWGKISPITYAGRCSLIDCCCWVELNLSSLPSS